MTKTKEFSIRASQLKEIVGDPLNYFYLANKPEITSDAIENGKEREILSYELFTKYMEGKIDHFEEQKEGVLCIKESGANIILTGHADILATGMVIDIKNSKRTDKELIDDYKWQLWAYCKIFGVYKAYLFVDSNSGNDMDLNKCRLVEIEWGGDGLWNVAMKSIANVLATANVSPYEYTTNCSQASTIEKYIRLSGEMKRMEQELKLLESQVDKILTTHNVVIWGNYRLYRTYRRSIKRNTKVEMLPWDGTYKPSFSFKEWGGKA